MSDRLHLDKVCFELREELGLNSYVGYRIKDRRILEMTEGSFLRARVELRLALREFGRNLWNCLPKWIRRQKK